MADAKPNHSRVQCSQFYPHSPHPAIDRACGSALQWQTSMQNKQDPCHPERSEGSAVRQRREGSAMRIKAARILICTLTLLLATAFASGQARRKIIIDQDAAGPAGSDQQAILLLIQSPHTEVLGITVVTGDAWLTEEVAHTLRTLEIIGRTDIPVVPGAENPLVRTKESTEQWEERYGSVAWLGAWTPHVDHAPRELGAMPEGKPNTKPSAEDAAHFLVRMVRKYPHEVTIYEG